MRYLFLFFSLCLSFSLKAEVCSIPKNDLKNIKFLFERLIFEHDFAYTVFGSKPMSLADISLEAPRDLPFYRKLKTQFFHMRSKRCLNTWYKYKNEFNFKDFILLDKEEDLVNCLVIVLINKKNLFDVLLKHEMIFKQELGDSFTPNSFLKMLEKKEISLAGAIQKNQRLLGIMLGYGERNATLFQERFNLMKAIAKRAKEELPEDEELTQKLKIMETQFSDFSELEEDPIIPPLYFLADIFHPETIELKQKYENDRQKIKDLMKDPNFMDRVLNRLVE